MDRPVYFYGEPSLSPPNKADWEEKSLLTGGRLDGDDDDDVRPINDNGPARSSVDSVADERASEDCESYGSVSRGYDERILSYQRRHTAAAFTGTGARARAEDGRRPVSFLGRDTVSEGRSALTRCSSPSTR